MAEAVHLEVALLLLLRLSLSRRWVTETECRRLPTTQLRRLPAAVAAAAAFRPLVLVVLQESKVRVLLVHHRRLFLVLGVVRSHEWHGEARCRTLDDA